MHDQAAARGIVPNPLQDFKAVQARHVEVEQQDIRHGMRRAISVATLPFQVSDGFRSVANELHDNRSSRFFDGLFEQESIITVILGQQYP